MRGNPGSPSVNVSVCLLPYAFLPPLSLIEGFKCLGEEELQRA